MRLPIRARLTVVSGVLMAVLLVVLGAFLYLRLRTELFEVVEEGLRSRAQALADEVGRGPIEESGGPAETEDRFHQVIAPGGRVVESSPGLPSSPVVSAEEIRRLGASRFIDTDVRLAGENEAVPVRILAVPVPDTGLLLLGASVEDQRDTLHRLLALLALIGPVAIGFASAAGWVVARAALRPVERMRSEADAVSASDPGRRLPVPDTGDELARLAETLNQMLARLEAAVERERRFVGDASHELRTPLANLKTELELALGRSRTQEELVAALRSAAEETDRLARLAEDLLVLARASGGRLPVRREETDIAALVDDVVRGFSTRASEKGVALEARIQDGLRARIDPTRLRQTVGNLLDNALRHTPRGGRVTVELAQHDAELSIVVTDTGEGFPASFLPKAFEPFSRADAVRGRDQGGTGLGLAIVRAVAKAHGGGVEARNRPGGGAVLVVRILT